jgi:hypothetical protein
MQTIKSPCIILDDGLFYIELNCNYEPSSAPGFLHRRCAVGVTTPGGYECIGSFDQTIGGMWSASIDAIYDPETDSDATGLGDFDQRLDAIVALWSARRSAYCRHSN